MIDLHTHLLPGYDDGARDWARDQAQWILKNHHPTPLEPKLRAELGRIVKALEREA